MTPFYYTHTQFTVSLSKKIDLVKEFFDIFDSTALNKMKKEEVIFPKNAIYFRPLYYQATLVRIRTKEIYKVMKTLNRFNILTGLALENLQKRMVLAIVLTVEGEIIQGLGALNDFSSFCRTWSIFVEPDLVTVHPVNNLFSSLNLL